MKRDSWSEWIKILFDFEEFNRDGAFTASTTGDRPNSVTLQSSPQPLFLLLLHLPRSVLSYIYIYVSIYIYTHTYNFV